MRAHSAQERESHFKRKVNAKDPVLYKKKKTGKKNHHLVINMKLGISMPTKPIRWLSIPNYDSFTQ